MTNYSDMKYNDLKKLAKERGLEATGTKEELLARLSDADGGEGAAEQAAPPAPANENVQEEEQEEAPQEAPEAPAAPTPAEEAGLQRNADRALRADAQKMKKHLEAQPKVSIMIPLDNGIKPEDAKKVPFTVNLNGYKMDIPRGEYVDVPKQVADVIRERLESEGKIGSQWRADRDAGHAEALS